MRRETTLALLFAFIAAITAWNLIDLASTPPPPDVFALTGRWQTDDGRELHLWLQENRIPGMVLSGFDGGFEATGLVDPATTVGGVWNLGSFHPIVLNLPSGGRGHYAQVQWAGEDLLLARFTDNPTAAAAPGFLVGPDVVQLRREGGPDVRHLPESH